MRLTQFWVKTRQNDKNNDYNKCFNIHNHDKNNNNNNQDKLLFKNNKTLKMSQVKEEESTHGENNNNTEILYIRAEVNGILTEVMIDNGENVSLISSRVIWIQREFQKIILTLPVNKINLIGATGYQNKSVRKQVLIEVKSNGSSIPRIFLVARDLLFNLSVEYLIC